MNLTKFNVRVYGLLLHTNNRILVADEMIRGQKITKFPGGGLELGESTVDCLIREFKEETAADIEITDHFYTTDIFQPSAFDDHSQVISIYYRVNCPNYKQIDVSSKKFDLDMLNGRHESFRWARIDQLLREKYLTLPLDRIVVSLLMENS